MEAVVKKVLVTGSNGYVGQPLCNELLRQGWWVRKGVRSKERMGLDGNFTITGLIDGRTNWRDALKDVDAVIHLAARVHIMKERRTDPLAAFMEVNSHGTANLIRQAAEAGVKRLIYLSTIKVNGESSHRPFSEQDIPRPQDAYAISKHRAEQALLEIGRETGIETVIVRPPLVYGPGVKANFFRLLSWVDRGLPLPFSSLQNNRSLVSTDNLIDFLCCCLDRPEATGQTFLVSDGEDLSTPALLRSIANAMARPLRMFSCPPIVVRLIGSLLDRSAEVDRLCGSLQIDISKAREVLGWKPPFSVTQGIDRTVQWYLTNRNKGNV